MSERFLTLEKRQATVDRLAAHFAHGHLTVTELEHRLDLAYAADTRAELTALESDLAAVTTETHPAPPSAQAPSAHNLIFSIFGGTKRRGRWMPSRRTTVLTMMGGTVLDFREAVMGASKVDLHLATAMGGVKIIVPPGVRVQWAGITLMGGVKVEESVELSVQPDTSVLWISGFVAMGGVKIIERLPHETNKQARRRRKARKAHRGHGNPYSQPPTG